MDRHTRIRVYAPDEQHLDEEFYERRKGEEGKLPVNMTEFRKAERCFKKKQVDFDGVLDLHSPESFGRARRIRKVEGSDAWVWGVEGVEGFYFIPTALNEGEQKHWIKRALTGYMLPPNLTNLDAHFYIPEAGLWEYFEEEKTLNIKRKPHPDDSVQTKDLPIDLTLETGDVEKLIRRIRWVTLGYQYDWTSKEYNFDLPPIPFPLDLADWSTALCHTAGFGPFKPEAGIVNFYQPGDTLTGHVDRSERNMKVPLVSISLGAPCIFLLGGKGRDDPVLPMLVRSGDVIIMSGDSRCFYHGVPRILPVESELKDTDPKIQKVLNLLGHARININIRQVNS